MAKLKWTVEYQIDESWVRDGFIMTPLRALDLLATDLNSCSGLRAHVLHAPRPSRIAKVQGFATLQACLGSQYYVDTRGIIHDKWSA